MTYAEAIQFLSRLTLFGMNPGLANTRKLAALAGNPHKKLRFIHVAGTNGKGSTCAMLESIYRAAGLRVGLFTSPHLVSFRERIQVNRRPIGEEEVVRRVEQMRPWIHEAPFQPTFFEAVTVMALGYFAEKECDLVVWETGLGGRLDATNIITPLASVITNISFDHQQWLGDTLAKIAFEKAGIIKLRVPVITATHEPEALEVITTTARKMKAPLTVVDHQRPTTGRFQEGNSSSAPGIGLPSQGGAGGGLPLNLKLPLLGEHQRLNAVVAVATVRAIQDLIPVNNDHIRRGLETVQWPGRLQVITTGSGQTVLLDGAHNAAGAVALRAALKAHFPTVRPTLILGILRDKDQSDICAALAPLADRILMTPVNSDRTSAPEDLLERCAKSNPSAELLSCSSLAKALEKAANDPCVAITGSLYLVGEAIELLGISTSARKGERGLNEWNQKK